MATYTYSLGSVDSTPVQRSTFLNNTYTQDVYSFSIGNRSSINLDLHNISAGDDADLSLYQDINNNGVLDASDQILWGSANSSSANDSINYVAGTGRYLAVVDRYSLGADGRLDYHLDLSATAPSTPPNLLPIETDLGSITLGQSSRSRTITRTGEVSSSDTADTYRFTATGYQGYVNIRAFLSGLSNDADIRLVQDKDRDQIVDSNEILRSSVELGTRSEYLQCSLSNTQLSQGDCFIQVYQYSGNTSYNLSMAFETSSYPLY